MLSDIGYGLSAIGYAVLLLLLIAVRKSGLAKYLLQLATAITCLWSVSFLSTWFGTISIDRLMLADSIKQLVWLLFLAACLKDDFTRIIQVLARPATWVILLVPLLSIILPYVFHVPAKWHFLIMTIIALEVLILLELIFRQAGDNSWAFKPLVLFLGTTNLYEFVTYANATMVEQLEPTYIAARGFIYAALLPFLVLAIRRIKNWGVDIFISRDVVLHSTLLMVAGAYLFIMAVAGYAVRYVGGEWGSSIQIVLIFLSLILLLTLFISNSFRTKIKVFITKHFFANQFDYRVEWLKLTQSLEAKADSLSQVYVSALHSLLQAINYRSGVLVKIVDGRQIVLANIEHQNLTSEDVQLVEMVSHYLQQKDWIVDIHELRYKPFVYEGLKINHALLNNCSFHLILPIYQHESLWGVALLEEPIEGTQQLNWELRDYLFAVSAQVSNYVFHYEAAQEVAENAQFAAFNRMSAFVLHDLKNVLAQIDLILCNAEQHKDNPEFINDTFETLGHTKSRMEKMLRQLTDKNEVNMTHQGLCTVSDCIQRVIVQRCASYLPKPDFELITETPVVLDEEKLSNVLYHLISNAQQATADDGWVKIALDKSIDEKFLLVTVSDNGTGMTEEFISQRLFKPFDTTKGNAGMGIGAYDAKNFMEKIGGQLQVSSELGVGSTFTLQIPIS